MVPHCNQGRRSRSGSGRRGKGRVTRAAAKPKEDLRGGHPTLHGARKIAEGMIRFRHFFAEVLRLDLAREEVAEPAAPKPGKLACIASRGRSAPITTPIPRPTAPRRTGFASAKLSSARGEGKCIPLARRGTAL